MYFNVEKTEEVIFSAKQVPPHHQPLNQGSDEIGRKSEHKHLGMILDSKLDLKGHTHEAIPKARQGIRMIRFLYKYVPVMHLTSSMNSMLGPFLIMTIL